MKFVLFLPILIILLGFSIADAQYLGNIEFYHLPVIVESKQYSILTQSIIGKFTGVLYDNQAGSLIFSISGGTDSIDTVSITMNNQTFLELLSTDYAKPPDSMLVLINGAEQPYKTVEYDEIISWRFHVPSDSSEIEIISSTPMFSTGTYSLEDIPFGAPSIYPPLKQNHVGIATENIQCKENLVLIQKYNGSPACVTESTKQKLIERGWTEKKISHSDNPLQQKWTLTTNGEISSIVISEDDSIIAVGTKTSDTQKGMLYLLGDDGTLLWNKEFDSMISNVGISNNTILVNGFHICGGGGGARTHCNYTADVFDVQGNRRHSVTHNDMTSFGISLSPNGSQIITHTYDVLNYFNINENESWKYVPDQSIRQATFLTDSILLVNTDNTGEIIALDNDGNKLWNFTTNYPSNYSFATSSNGKYFVVSDYTSPDDGNIYLLDYNGNLLWQANTGNTVLHLEFSGDDSHILAEINGAFMVYDMQRNLLWKNNIPSDLTISSDASFLLGTTFNQGTGASITMFNGKGNILFNNSTGKDSLSAVFDLSSNDEYLVIANDTNQLVMFEVSPDFDKIDYDLTDLRNSDILHVMVVPKIPGLFDVTIAKGDSLEIPWDIKFDQGFTRSNFDVSIISDSDIESQITPTNPYVTINGKPPGEKIITIHPLADAVTGNYAVKILGRGETVHNQTGWMTNLDEKTLGTINVSVISK